MSHTPGKWKVFKHSSGQPEIQSESVKTTFGEPRKIALVYEGLIDSEGQANARLIAAAPELLKALIDVPYPKKDMNHRGAEEFIETYKSWLRIERDQAIAKAEGK